MYFRRYKPSVLIAILLTACGFVYAQFPQPVGPTQERIQTDGERDLEERIANMRYLISLADKRRPAKKDPKLALEQLQEDFVRIQTVNKDLVLTTNKTEKPELKFVAKSAAEINKRALRLIENLALPESDASNIASDVAITDAKQLKKAIVAMGWLIYGFTKNPMFKEAQVIDAGSSQKARRDLDSILALSTRIKTSCDQMNKNR